jgi:hypothetical protein
MHSRMGTAACAAASPAPTNLLKVTGCVLPEPFCMLLIACLILRLRFPVLQSAPYSSGYGGLSSLSGISNISSSSIGLALTPPQPHKVWIGRPTAVTEEGFAPCGLGPEGLGLAGEQEQDGMGAGPGAVSGGGGEAGSRRASRQRGSGRLPSGPVNLPSLVAA